MATAEPPTSDSSSNEVPFYRQVLSITLLRWLSIVSFILAVAMLLFWSFEPERLNHPIARFVVSVLVGLLFAVFFFVFYPDHLEMKLPKVLGTPIRLTGPIVLFFVVSWYVSAKMPTPPPPPAGKLYQVLRNGEHGGMYLGTSASTSLRGRDGDTPPEHMLVGFPDGRRELYGIYVIFPENKTSMKVSLHHEGWAKDLSLVLSRDDKSVIDITEATDISLNP
jgi:hypothetical protein